MIRKLNILCALAILFNKPRPRLSAIGVTADIDQPPISLDL